MKKAANHEKDEAYSCRGLWMRPEKAFSLPQQLGYRKSLS